MSFVKCIIPFYIQQEGLESLEHFARQVVIGPPWKP